MLTVQEVAERMRVTARRVRKLIAEGRIPAERIGSQYLIREPFTDPRKKAGRPAGPEKETTE